jgi:hypothetical protein
VRAHSRAASPFAGSVRIEAEDRAARERLLRYCARPPFALNRLHECDREHLIYHHPKPGPGGSGPQLLTPLELLDRLAVLVPPPRIHRRRYFGVLAPNAPLRTAVTAFVPEATTAPPSIEPARPPLWDLPDAGAGDFDPLRPAGTRVRVRSTHRLVTSTVHRPPRTTPGRRVPALAEHAIPAR